MNILMPTNRFFPDIGGVEKHVLKISKEFVKKGHKVTILTFCENENYPSEEEIEEIKIIRINEKVNKLELIKWNLKNIKLFLNSEIIHCHDFVPFLKFCLFYRIILFWKKNYITFHGWEGNVPPQKRIIFKRKIVEKLTKGNICIGDYIKKWYKTNPTLISYGATDVIESKNLVEKNLFVYVGRLEKDTGIEMYLQAVKEIKDEYDLSLKIEICGDGSLREKLKKFVKENSLNIKFNGFIENVDSYISRSEFCLTSGYLSILEGMIQKKLVITTYDNNLKEDYLKLFPNQKEMFLVAGSVEELKQEIVEILRNNEKKARMLTYSYNWVKKMTWEKMAENYLKLWKD